MAVRRRPQLALSEAARLWPLPVALLGWQVGAHVDAWHHAHNGSTIESFATWPHALLYAGWAAVGALVVGRIAVRGSAATAVSRGYLVAALGVVWFGLGGLLDFVWHALFGFEADLETLFAPSHLWLLVGVVLAAFGTLRAATELRLTAGTPGDRLTMVDLPVVITVAVLYRSALWTLFYVAPLAVDYAAGGTLASTVLAYSTIDWHGAAARVAGTTGILLHSVLLALFLMLSLRHLRLPAGSIAAMMLWDGLLTAAVTGLWLYLGAVVAGAIAGEAMWGGIRRGRLLGMKVEYAYWALACLVSVVQFSAYFVLMAAFGGGIRWTPHLWAGAIGAAALFALTAAVLAAPPRWLTPTAAAGLDAQRRT